MLEGNTSPKGQQITISPKLIVLVLVAIVIILLAATSLFVVDQTEQSVVLRLGRFQRTVGPGLQFKLPLGIEQNYNVPTQRILNMTFGFRDEGSGLTTGVHRGDYPEESIMLTGDLNIIDVEWIIQYRITDPRAWLFNVQERETTIRDISQSVTNKLVGDLAILDVIGPERTNIEYMAQRDMQRSLDQYGLGITITTVRLRNIVPPKGEVQDAFEDVNRAIQDMNRLVNEGREQYNRAIPRAQGEAAQLIQQAEGYASERVNTARGDVARFASILEAYQTNEDVTRTRLYYETMEAVFEKTDGTTIIDKTLENFLPLQSIQQRNEGGVQ